MFLPSISGGSSKGVLGCIGREQSRREEMKKSSRTLKTRARNLNLLWWAMGETLNYNQKGHESAHCQLVSLHNGQTEIILKCFIEMQKQAMRYYHLHIKFVSI